MANGILVIDKPAGWTSMDVCAKLRGVSTRSGWATAAPWTPWPPAYCPSLSAGLPGRWNTSPRGEKEYIAALRLGLITDTQDTTGTILEEREATVTGEQLEAVLARFTGEIEQLPPMYSAIKVNGKKLYELAREGKEIVRKPRHVYIHYLEIEKVELPWVTMRIGCSKGTYIRTLCHDIGQKLGCGGTMASLERTKAGIFFGKGCIAVDRYRNAAGRREAYGKNPSCGCRTFRVCGSDCGVEGTEID